MMCFVIDLREKYTPAAIGTRISRDLAVGIARKGMSY